MEGAAAEMRQLDQQITEAHVFKITLDKLRNIFKYGGERRGMLNIEEHGDVDNIVRKLASDPTSGITGDDRDL